jgi:hypothetical protein
MKRLTALLALVLVLMAGTAGMASALTLGFDSSPSTPPELPYPQIAAITGMDWDATGWSGGHLYAVGSYQDSTIAFASPVYVNNFQINGMLSTDFDPNYYTFGPLAIEAHNNTGGIVWSTRIENISDYWDLTDSSQWLTVDVNRPNVASIVFKAPNPEGKTGYDFSPSLDNLVINETAAVPIPASVWLLASGLLGLAGLRRKLSH